MIYFDNAATTIHKPKSVIKAVTEAMTVFGNPGRGVHTASLNASRCIYSARKNIAGFLGAEDFSTIAFMSNATEALNTAIMGIFNRGDHIISTVTEHNSVLRPLYLLEKIGVEVDYIGADEKGVLKYDMVQELIKSNTRAFVINHCSNVTGNINDLSFFVNLKKKYGLYLIVDGAQSAGIIPVNVRDVDVFCFTGHKGLFGPQGTGGLYVSPDIKIRPLKSGGSGIHSFDRMHPSKMPEALEAGTLNSHGIAGLNAAVDYINGIGIKKIYERETNLARQFYEGIKSVDNVMIYGDFSSNNRVPVISINIGDYDSGYVSDVLSNEYEIATRSGIHCAPNMHIALGTAKRGIVRFSFGINNTSDEIEQAVCAVRNIAMK